MKTKIHFYNFDLTEQGEEWEKLRAFLVAEIGLDHRMKALGYFGLPFKDGEEIELDENALFSNQWNTAGEDGVRVFDWRQQVRFDGYGREIRTRKSGHWLEQTEEMRTIRTATVTCGFCAHKGPADEEGEFCSACLDSPYLGEHQLHLLRMRPVLEHFPDRPPLTAQEKEELLPKYVHAQTVAKDSRAKRSREKARNHIKDKYDRTLASAEIEYKGMTWLLDHSIPIDNVIYYSHQEKFVFGWRNNGLSEAVYKEVLDKVEGFPYSIEVKKS